MIKPNKSQQSSILRSGYRNQLKKHSQNSQSIKGSQTNRSDFEDGIKSTVSKQTRRLNQNKSQSSQRSRNTSVQRALNTAFGTHPVTIPPQPTTHTNHVHFQQQSHVRQTFPIVPSSQYHYKKPLIQRHPSQPIAQLNHSQTSDVNTQIQTLNRLRQEHEIIKQVTSDDQLKEYDNNDRSGRSGITQGEVSRRKYVYDSRESVPVQIIRNKKLGSRFVTGVNKSGINSNNNSNRNPQRQQQEQGDKYSVESSKDQNKPNNSNTNNSKSKHLKQSSQTQTRSKQPHQLITTSLNNNRQYLIQISTLQSALTQSSIKIQQLLTQSIKSKQKLKQHSQLLQKAHRLQNQLKMMKQTQKYLKRQIQMKDQEIQRFEKRTRIMKQTMEMMEKQLQMKEREVAALQGLVIGGRMGDVRNYYGQNYSEQLEKIKELMKEKELMRGQIQNEMKKKQLLYQRSRGKQTLGINQSQSLENLNNKLKLTQQKLDQLQSINLKLTLQLQSQKQRNTQYLQQTISSRIKYELANSSVSNTSGQIDSKQSLMGKEIQSIRQELSKLQAANHQENQTSYVNELQMKLKSLQQVIRNQNNEKMRFIKQIQRIRQQQKINSQKLTQYTQQINQLRQQNITIKKQNQLHKTQLTALKSYNSSLTKLQSQITVNCVTKEQYIQVERQRNQLKQQVDVLEGETNSLKQKLTTSINHEKTITAQQKQQLLRNLDEIKQQYLKLQQAYFDKAKECQQIKLQMYEKNSHQIGQLEEEIERLQSQLQSERHYTQELQQKVHQKEFKLIEFLNIAQNTTTYNQKITQLHQHISALQLKLKQKDFHINQIMIQHKKLLNQQKQSLNQLHLQLSQKSLQLIDVKNSLQQQRKIHLHETQNYLKQLQIKKHELEEQHKHYEALVKMDKEMGNQQVRMLQGQIFSLVKEKEKLLEETLKMSHLEYQLKTLIMKDKNNRKMNESIDHLWMIKEAEYFNLDQILNLVKSSHLDRQEEQSKSQQNQMIRISEDY